MDHMCFHLIKVMAPIGNYATLIILCFIHHISNTDTGYISRRHASDNLISKYFVYLLAYVILIFVNKFIISRSVNLP